ncbi:MAG TPA: SPFH domain-containing protein, partial [Flavipsychrobacter sp.]|nr:SPFH domain-containing protein [Flavipsychrobacter sp.]
MKRVIISPYSVGLLLKNGAYKRMLKEGAYWLWPSEEVQVYDTTRQFHPLIDLNILLQDRELAAALQVVEVKDSQIALQYKNGLLVQVLTPSEYAFWKGIVKNEFVFADTSKLEITENIDRAALQGKLLAPYVRSYTVEQYEKAVLFVDGKYAGVLEPGVYLWWRNSIMVYVGKVDTRKQQAEINGQEMLTRDKAAIRLNAYGQYKVVDVEKALLKNKDYDKQLYVAFQLALREYVGTLTLDEL